jgi:DNA (cytosine-5)-methyltransferase 1
MTTNDETALVLDNNHSNRARPVDQEMPTLTTATTKGLIQSFIAELRGGSSDARPVADPLATVCASGNHHALIEPEPFMLERRGEYRTRSLDDPMSTLTANDTTKALITPAGGSWNDDARPVDEALRSLTTRDAYALLAPYYTSGSGETARSALDVIGALTTRDRYALVMRNNTARGDQGQMLTPALEELRTLTTKGHQSLVTPGEQAAAESMVDDCLFRMLEPHEVAAGMAFPGDYEWQPYTLKAISRRDLVKLAGNAVTPPASRDLMTAVAESLGAVA